MNKMILIFAVLVLFGCSSSEPDLSESFTVRISGVDSVYSISVDAFTTVNSLSYDDVRNHLLAMIQGQRDSSRYLYLVNVYDAFTGDSFQSQFRQALLARFDGTWLVGEDTIIVDKGLLPDSSGIAYIDPNTLLIPYRDIRLSFRLTSDTTGVDIYRGEPILLRKLE